MVLDAVSNFVRGNTDAEVGTSDTTVSVADASIFPDPATDGEFNVVIWDVNNFPRPDQDGDVEILRVTERDTTDDELTVTRGQEITSAAAHPEGSAIHLSPTAKMFSDIESTFGDFWDAGTQELTADVNNTNTTTQSLEAASLDIADVRVAENGSFWGSGGWGQPTESPGSTTSDSFVTVAELSGGIIIPENPPEGLTLYGLFYGRAEAENGLGEVAPRFMRQSGGLSSEILDELTLEFDQTSFDNKDTGWVEITSVSTDNGASAYRGGSLEARVDDGEINFSTRERFGVSFKWVVEG